MGTEFTIIEWPYFIAACGLMVTAFILVLVGGLGKRIMLVYISLFVAFMAVPLGLMSARIYTADTIQYPDEKTSSMELLPSPAEKQGDPGRAQGADGKEQDYYQTERTADGVSRTVFVVKNPYGSQQHVVVDSKQVKVLQDVPSGQAPYVVKHQGVYTNTRVYREGGNLCLKDVSTGCQPNAVLNTSNENDNMYDLHVPAGAARSGDNSASNH